VRVLVTGAQGCIGAWVVKVLIERGVDLVLYDSEPNPVRLSLLLKPETLARVPVEVGKIEDTARLKALVKDGGVTHIVHLAALQMPFCQADPVEGAMVNVIGSLNVFTAARDAGRTVHVIYASSSAVWGPEEHYGSGKLTEDDPIKPSTHYGVFKQANEGNARAFYLANGIPSIGLRPWTVYGVGRDRGLTGDATLAMRAVAERQPFRIRVSGNMDLQYVEDVAEIFVKCLLVDLEGTHVFNLEGSVIDMQDLVRALERMRPGASELISVDGPKVPVAYRMDDSQLRARVPGIPKTPLEDGMGRTLEYFERLRLHKELALV
jgi:nucleoside-diphosphate-sugar epimerase